MATFRSCQRLQPRLGGRPRAALRALPKVTATCRWQCQEQRASSPAGATQRLPALFLPRPKGSPSKEGRAADILLLGSRQIIPYRRTADRAFPLWWQSETRRSPNHPGKEEPPPPPPPRSAACLPASSTTAGSLAFPSQVESQGVKMHRQPQPAWEEKERVSASARRSR